MGQLVLSRKVGERVIIAPPGHEPIVVTVGMIERRDGDRNVRLAFEAPRSTVIDREEVWMRREAEQAKERA